MSLCIQDSIEHGAALLSVGRICATTSATATVAAAAALPRNLSSTVKWTATQGDWRNP